MDVCRDHDIAYEGYFECPICVANSQLRALKRELEEVLAYGHASVELLTEDILAILNDPDHWSTQ